MNDWNTSTDPEWMFWHLNDKVPERKRRLLAAAICRHIGHLMTEARCRRLLVEAQRLSVYGTKPVPCKPDFLLLTLDEVERCADNLALVKSLAAAAKLADHIGSFTSDFYYSGYSKSWGAFDHDLIASCNAAVAVCHAASSRLDLAHLAAQAAHAVYRAAGGDDHKKRDPGEEAAQCALIRDVFPSHTQPVSFSSAWRTDTVLSLASQMYESRDFSLMPILADALQDADCDNDEVLNHCRDANQVHARGCWVVDLVLGKE